MAHRGTAPTIDSVIAAAGRLRPEVRRTPVLTSTTLNEHCGAQLFFKCENFQHTGSFKFRGASNAVLMLTDDQAPRGVATHSSGNHGAALALAARRRGIPAHIVVPRGAVQSKIDNIERYGGRMIWCEPTQAGREEALIKVAEQTGANPVPPYDDPRIIAGQGSCALELVEQVSELDMLLTPVGGGGLISGTALVAAAQDSPVSTYGAEPEGADDTVRSLQSGAIVADHQPDTICDGLRARVGELNFELIRSHVNQVLPVSDTETVNAMRLLWSVLKSVVEPSSATAMAAVMRYADLVKGKRIGIILSGGNVDLNRLPWTVPSGTER